MGTGQRGRRALAGLLASLALGGVPAQGGPTIVPVPEVVLDPNEGNTWGLMLAMLFKDANNDVRYLFAPDVRYNDYRGVYPVLRLLAYPSEDRFYSIAIGKSTTKDQKYEAEYENYELLDHAAFLEASVSYEDDSTERFWGFGNDSDEDEESNYTSEIFLARVEPGYYLRPKLHVSLDSRVLFHDVSSGQVPDFPFIAVEHPEVRGRGLEGAWFWLNRAALTWDSRDSRKIPKQGSFAELYVDGSSEAWGSDKSFLKWGIEAKTFHSFRAAKNPTLALRAGIDWMTGDDDSPFYLMNTVGGRRSLRGFGGDRFIDFNRALASAELRTRVWSHRLFGVDLDVEIAPFVDTGQVFADLGDSPVSDLHWVVGNGFRGLVRPQILAFVDLGYGSEGLAVFTGIDYPF
ncbi:MAG TPA: BamA/TamA family outer membrane protein [Candidatus Limnocylindria bacterium]|nr:BamA/TamA family outer membrane protein [Candidatus Limnocylindria bacterium]